MPSGGRRPGAGRKPKSAEHHGRDRTRPRRTTPKPRTRRHRIICPQIGVAFEAAWTDEPAAEWPEELVEGVIMPPRMVAHHAIIDYCRCWQRDDGMEYADDIGVAYDVIEKAYGRAQRPTRKRHRDATHTRPHGRASPRGLAALLVDAGVR